MKFVKLWDLLRYFYDVITSVIYKYVISPHTFCITEPYQKSHKNLTINKLQM